MVRRVTPSQFRSMVRRAETKQRRAINEYNSAVRRHNSEVRRAVDSYNRDVNAYNARVRANRQRLQREIARLNSQPTTRITLTQRSTVTLHAAYERVERDFDAGLLGDRGSTLVDLAEAETANSAYVSNALLGQADGAETPADDSGLADELAVLSPDLRDRWRGALFSLNPQNPEAARHFCTSAREIILQLIEMKASDPVVLSANAGCERTKDGKPSRRAKVQFMLARYGESQQSVEDFVETDLEDVVGLVREVNSGTHGSAGRFDVTTLRAIRARVEGSVRLLATLAANI